PLRSFRSAISRCHRAGATPLAIRPCPGADSPPPSPLHPAAWSTIQTDLAGQLFLRVRPPALARERPSSLKISGPWLQAWRMASPELELSALARRNLPQSAVLRLSVFSIDA